MAINYDYETNEERFVACRDVELRTKFQQGSFEGEVSKKKVFRL